MSKLILGPFVNINGTSRKELLEQAQDVLKSCHELMAALRKAAPHGRDYQTVPNQDTFKHDREAWNYYYQQVTNIYDEYQGIAFKLIKQGDF